MLKIKTNFRIFNLSDIFIVGALILLDGCTATVTQTLSCTSSASVVSGDTSAANTSIGLNNLSVVVSNGTGPYQITVPGLSTATSSSATYTYASTFYETTGSSGGLSTTVSVTDTSNSSTASCSLSTLATTSSTNLPSIAASPSTSASVNSTITLTASATDGASSPTFVFSLASSIFGVTLTTLSNTTAYVTSSVETSVTVNVAEYSNGILQSTGTITLTFSNNTSSSSGTPSLTVSPSQSTTVGSSITLYASDVTGASSPSYSFALSSSVSGVTLSTGSNYAVVSSSVATSVTVIAYEYSSGTLIGSNSITLTFTGSSSSLACSVSIGSRFNYGSYGIVPVSVIASTGEAVQILQILGPAQLCYAQSFSSSQFYLECLIGSGTTSIQVYAQSQSRPGVYCNDGAPMTVAVGF